MRIHKAMENKQNVMVELERVNTKVITKQMDTNMNDTLYF